MNSSVHHVSQSRLTMDVMVIAMVTVACLVPFLNRPLHVDDPLFVWNAKHIAAHPTDYFGCELNWGLTREPIFHYTQNPPFACYWLALAGASAGWSEIALHFAMLPVSVAASLGAFAVARLLCGHARWASLISISTPVFVVSATTLMCDVMMLAFWCWAVFFWLLAHRRGQVTLLFVAAAMATLAGLTKYFGLALVPLLLGYSAIASPRRMLGRSILAMLLPLVVLVTYEFLSTQTYGHSPLRGAMRFATQQRYAAGDSSVVPMLFAAVVYPGGCVLSLVFFAPWMMTRKGLICLSVFVGAFTLAAIWLYQPYPAQGSIVGFYLHVAVFSAAGASLIGLTIADGLRHRDAESLLLTFWIVGTVVFATFINWSVNGRSVLPLVPAAGIVVVRRLEAQGWTLGTRPWLSGGPLVAAFLVSLVVAWGDYAHAAADRDAALALTRLCKDQHQRVWYTSHWGFQYYLELSGLDAIDTRNCQIKAGELYARPQINAMHQLPEQVMELRSEMQFPAAPLGSTMTGTGGSGFYATMLGPLPYSLAPQHAYHYFVYSFPKDISINSGEGAK